MTTTQKDKMKLQKQWECMTAEDRRIKVAELTGWINGAKVLDPKEKGRTRVSTAMGKYTWLSPTGTSWAYDSDELPNYLNDLNAIVQAEIDCHMFSSWDTKSVWIKNLKLAVLGRDCFSLPDWGFVLQATAAQRCEALVMTLEEISIPQEIK